MKLKRFENFITESKKVNIELMPTKKVDIMDKGFKLEIAAEGKPPIMMEYKGVTFHVSGVTTSTHMEDPRLRYSAVIGVTSFNSEGNPKFFDWVVYSATEDGLVQELRKMIPEYKKANNIPDEGVAVQDAVAEAESARKYKSKEDEDKKTKDLLDRLEKAMKKKGMKDEEADKLRKKLRGEIDKKGIDKIEQELKKRYDEEDRLKSGGDDGGDSKVKKVKNKLKDELWKGYKQDVSPFWDNMYDLLYTR